MNTLLNDRILRGDLYSRITRNLSNARQAMLMRCMARDTIAVLAGSLLSRMPSMSCEVSEKSS